MRLLSWLLRFIILAIIVNMVIRLFMAKRRASPSMPGGGRGPRVPERQGGTLVRDPQCGTYIPRSNALQLGNGDSAHYFCSDGCRTAWTAAHPS